MTESLRDTHHQARRLAAGRLMIGIATIAILTVILQVVPERYRQLSTVSPTADTNIGQLRPEDAQIMADSGLSVQAYATYFTIFDFSIAVASILTALVIAWHRPNDRLALLAALMFAGLAGLIITPGMIRPQWQILVLAVRVIFYASAVPFIYLFPDGRFVPRWTRWLIAAWLFYCLIWIIFPVLGPPF